MEAASPPPADSAVTQAWQNISDPKQWTAGDALGVLTALAAFLGFMLTYWPTRQQRRKQKLLQDNVGADFYDAQTIRNATLYYIPQSCSSVDPTQEAELRHVVAAQEDSFAIIDRYLDSGSQYRHLLLLGDSGMGKSALLLNYYAHNQRRRSSRRHRIFIVPLGVPDALSAIERIPDKRDACLFLDAFDEDTKAVHDGNARLVQLMEASVEFKRVLITCRTQFFERDEEIPRQTGIAVVGPRGPGQPGMYEFWKLYLAPLNDEQIERFIRKRYPFRTHFLKTWGRRERARSLAAKIPLLTARPMLLSYIPEIAQDDARISFSFQLYDLVVENWLERESHWWGGKEVLREMSERLAADLYVNRERRGFERINKSELADLTAGISESVIESWKITTRSLLNRDAMGNLKFAHRSMMEYLFVRGFVEGKNRYNALAWTDNMLRMLNEMVKHEWAEHFSLPKPLTSGDLMAIPNFSCRPLYAMRSKPVTVDSDAFKRSVESVDHHKYTHFNPHFFKQSRLHPTRVFVDFATGLCWPLRPWPQPVKAYEVDAAIKQLNASRFGGWGTWRVPTYEELVETYAEALNSAQVALAWDPAAQKGCWISDYTPTGGFHVRNSLLLAHARVKNIDTPPRLSMPNDSWLIAVADLPDTRADNRLSASSPPS